MVDIKLYVPERNVKMEEHFCFKYKFQGIMQYLRKLYTKYEMGAGTFEVTVCIVVVIAPLI